MSDVFSGLGFAPADILIPKDIDIEKWSVVACDQFTSEPEYWERAAREAEGSPSTLNLILPESELGKDGEADKIKKINATMEEYLNGGVFAEYRDALVYVERTQSDGRVRRGIVGKFDLTCYDYTPGSNSLIRATEGTVLERIPPRLRVRKDAPIELPHVMVLIDDPGRTVIEPLAKMKDSMELLYDSDLMLGGGHIRGYLVPEEAARGIAAALRALTAPEVQSEKYGTDGSAPLLFAVGDGNHSLATAKQCYAEKNAEGADIPARYALAELVNDHDDALEFEPIHRLIFNADPEDMIAALKEFEPSLEEDAGQGAASGDGVQRFTVVSDKGERTFAVREPRFQLAHGTVQAFLDEYSKDRGWETDYIHGDDTLRDLVAKHGAVGILLPPMDKQDLFRTVVRDGVLPRKTFSMGNAEDKRYYLEARKIV